MAFMIRAFAIFQRRIGNPDPTNSTVQTKLCIFTLYGFALNLTGTHFYFFQPGVQDLPSSLSVCVG